MLALRLAFTGVVLVLVVWLLRDGKPLGGVLLVPLAAIWLRQAAELRLGRRASRAE
mgnify:CR=1 FL=1